MRQMRAQPSALIRPNADVSECLIIEFGDAVVARVAKWRRRSETLHRLRLGDAQVLERGTDQAMRLLARARDDVERTFGTLCPAFPQEAIRRPGDGRVPVVTI